jgi:hypothetical protein
MKPKGVRAYFWYSGDFGLRMSAMPRPLCIQYAQARYRVMSRATGTKRFSTTMRIE